MYSVFQDFHLTAPKELKISEWKNKSQVKLCFGKLHKKINDSDETYMSRIIQELNKGKKNISKVLIAYAVSICELVLDPQNLEVQISEKAIKPIYTKNLVSI
jgi:aspartate carbamoyltransferase catalytic subunit